MFIVKWVAVFLRQSIKSAWTRSLVKEVYPLLHNRGCNYPIKVRLFSKRINRKRLIITVIPSH